MMNFDLIFLSTGLLLLLIFGYLFFLAAVSLWPEKKEKRFPAQTRFGIIIPAHNESELIGHTLAQVQAVDYPRHLYEIVVIADNCVDNTAEIALSYGVTCWRRRDAEKRGKGNVLRWVFPRLLEYGDHEAYVIIDADTHIDAGFLKVVNSHFCGGAKVVQGYSQVRHPERSPMESLAFLGFALNRNLRYRGRRRLGWTTNLMVTGMCFLREVISRHGWNTISMVEDIEYEMFLHLNDIRVTFATDAKISVELHNSVQQSKGQRTRWDMGKFEVRNRFLPKLLKAFFNKKDLSYLDSSMELILPPFSLLCAIVLTCCALFFVFGDAGWWINFYIRLAILLCLVLYILVGLATVKTNAKVYRSLMYAPFFIVWRSWIIFLEFLKKNKQRQW